MSDKILPHNHGNEGELTVLREQLAEIDHFQVVSDVFKQLGDTTRVRIFWLLCHCEECVINISAMMEMSSPAVSHHLRPLRASGLIVSRRVGKEVYYKAADTEQSRLLHEMIEKVMEITCPDSEAIPSGYQLEHEEIIREIHEQMIYNLDQRFTIESLSRQYLMNPTTLKNVFKAVYGNSIAAHMKEHRMEAAAKLLTDTTDSVAQIARAVGYDNQSKFTANFKGYYQMLPTDYRKQYGK